jgi:hypothetical protein
VSLRRSAACHAVIMRLIGREKTSTGPLPRLVGSHQLTPAFFASLRGVPKCKQAPSP